MIYTETRSMDAGTLRDICIRNNWYTRGTNADYNRLFDRLYDDAEDPLHLTTEKLAEIAQDILDHSNITDYTITTVMVELAQNCIVWFREQH